MDKEHAFLKGYTERLIEKGRCLSDIGLWNGKMGDSNLFASSCKNYTR